MSARNSTLSATVSLMAWREILAQVLGPLGEERDVSPEWLVNPGTGRRLKLDLYYPEVGLAVRFRGLKARGQRRVSDWHLLEEQQREEVREALCRLHGVTLVGIDLWEEHPRRCLDRLYTALSTASRRVAHASLSHDRRVALLDALAAARQRLTTIRARVRGPEDLALFAEKWRDRETAAVREVQRSLVRQINATSGQRRRYTPGMAVQHERFGSGTVVAVQRDGEDERVTVEFPQAGRRTFLASLVKDKLVPADPRGNA